MKKTVLKIGRMVAIASSCFLFGFVDASAQKILRKSENMRPVWLVSKTPETTNETFINWSKQRTSRWRKRGMIACLPFPAISGRPGRLAGRLKLIFVWSKRMEPIQNHQSIISITK